jgi:hypothetical protein
MRPLTSSEFWSLFAFAALDGLLLAAMMIDLFIQYRRKKVMEKKLRQIGNPFWVVIVALLLFSAAPAQAQSGTVALQTVNTTVCWAPLVSGQCTAQAIATATPSLVFPNVGQSAHQIQVCGTHVTSLQIRLEQSPDNGTTWIPITPTLSNLPIHISSIKNCGQLEAGEYYPNVRANLLFITGSTGFSLTAWYSGSAGPIPSRSIGLIDTQLHSSASMLAVVSQSSGNSNIGWQSYVATNSVTNPATGAYVIGVFPGLVAYQSILLSCSAACQIDVYQLPNGGACTPISPINLNFNNDVTSSSTVTGAPCTSTPTGGALIETVFLGANATQNLNIDGFYAQGVFSTQGVAVFVHTGITGTVSATEYWYGS